MLTKLTAIGWKDALIRFSSRSELLFFLILPIVFTLLLSGGFPSAETNPRLPLLVVNDDGSPLADDLLAELAALETVNVVTLTSAEAQTAFADGDAAALLTIPVGFEATVVAGDSAEIALQTAPNNNNALALQQAVASAVARVSQPLVVARASLAEAEAIAPFASPSEAQAYFEESRRVSAEMLSQQPPRLERTRLISAEGESNTFAANAHTSAGQLITWVFIPLLGISALFAFERRQGTLRRLLTTPTHRATYLLGTISGQFVMALVQMALLVGFGVLVMKVDWGNAPLGLIVMLVSFGLAGVALGTMLGTFVKSEGQANGLSILLGMLMALLGGCWWPYELFPPAVQQAVKLLPTTWAMQGLTDLTMRGLALPDILPEAGVLVVFALVFFAIGVWRFRFE